MIVLRKLFSDDEKSASLSGKIKSGLKKAGKSIEHAVTNPKETGKKAAGYVKKHPDEALVLGGSYAVPGVLAAKLAKAGKGKQAALVGSIAALPIGEGYVAAKVGIRKLKNRNNDNKA